MADRPIMPPHQGFEVDGTTARQTETGRNLPRGAHCECEERCEIPGPREELAGCVWLPRLLKKARLLKIGSLPPDYAARFCHPTGVDGHFLSHFGLTREAVLDLAELPDSEAAACFLSRSTSERIEQWNRIAVNLGRPGFPMADRLPAALATSYQHLDPRRITTVFEALEADEQATLPKPFAAVRKPAAEGFEQ